MALVTLKPTIRVISFMLGGTEYNTVLDTISIRSDAPEIDEQVFSNENTGGVQTIGTERLTIGLGGPTFVGATEGNPLLPLASYQGVAFTYSAKSATANTAHTIAGTMNLISAGPDARAGGAARNSATARSTGAITVSWPTTS